MDSISFTCDCGRKLFIPVGYSANKFSERFIKCRTCGHKYNVEVEDKPLIAIPKTGLDR